MAQSETERTSVRGGRYLLYLAAMLPFMPYAGEPADELTFEIQTLPGYQKYVALLEYPGYIGVALENNDLHPTLSGKMIVRERGRELGAENVFIRFTGRTASSYAYEAGLSLGIGKTSVTFPVSVDLSALASGKTIVVAKLPLANLIPSEMRERIQAKVRTLANVAAQQKVLEYLDERTNSVGSGDSAALMEAILLDAYNRSRAATPGADVGDAVPLSEQWMLIVTLAIWFIAFPIFLVVYRLRRRRAKPVVP